MKITNVKEAKQDHNQKMGVGCGISILAFILMLVLPFPLNGIFFIVFLTSLIYGLIQHHEVKVVRGNAIRKQLPRGFDHHITLTPHKDHSVNIARHFGDTGTSTNPELGDIFMCLNSSTRKILFWRDGKFSPSYYLTNVSFTPDVKKSKANNQPDGHSIKIAIDTARKRRPTLRTNALKSEYGTNAYLQLVTTDFKHLKQIHILNVKAADYQTLMNRYRLDDLRLKRLEKRSGLINAADHDDRKKTNGN